MFFHFNFIKFLYLFIEFVCVVNEYMFGRSFCRELVLCGTSGIRKIKATISAVAYLMTTI